MSRIHIQTGSASNRFEAVCHAPTPAGNNAAAVPWKTAIANSGPPVTSMVIGNGAGQISTAEANQVAGGDVIEVRFQFDDNPLDDSATRSANLNAIASDAVARAISEMQARLKYFGKDIA